MKGKSENKKREIPSISQLESELKRERYQKQYGMVLR